MPTMPLQRRAGARTAALAALTIAGSALLGSPALAAPTPVPGDNGDVKIHKVGASVPERDNQPHVCRFYLDAFNFDAAEKVTWTIAGQPPTAGAGTKTGTLTTDATGAAHTDPITLSNGHYKLTWQTSLGHGAGKMKVFWVDCTNSTASPHGGPPAGGGGLARDAAINPVAGAAAVGLAAVGGAVYFRLRRRPHGRA